MDITDEKPPTLQTHCLIHEPTHGLYLPQFAGFLAILTAGGASSSSSGYGGIVPDSPLSRGVFGGNGGGSILYGGGFVLLGGSHSDECDPFESASGLSSSATMAILSLPAAMRYCDGVGALATILSGSLEAGSDGQAGSSGESCILELLWGRSASTERRGDDSTGL